MGISRFYKGVRLAVAGVLLSSGVAAADPIHIGVANFGDHPQLNAAIAGFKAALTDAGYVEGKDIDYSVQHVNFDATLVPQMLAKLRSEKPDLILAVTTPVSQMAKNAFADTDIPIVFTAVTDPVAAGLVPSWDKGGKNISGSSDLQDVPATMQFIKKLLPDAKTVGLPYNPGEANDVALRDIFKKAAEDAGLKFAEVGVDSANDIQQRVRSLAGKADVIYGPASNLIQPAIAAVAATAREAQVPVVNSDDGPVKEGLIPASFSVGYFQVGRNAGKIAARVLKGEDISTIAPTKPSYEDHKIVISKSAMAAYGAKIPTEFANCDCLVK